VRASWSKVERQPEYLPIFVLNSRFESAVGGLRLAGQKACSRQESANARQITGACA
jgi:hypothetical protein